ncbi:hypothetical protein OS187_04715 [Xanthomonadaceae bacterium JHOS43]|nr:hypothetical protein [Xanthomonadaceae bacterium JHOS43]
MSFPFRKTALALAVSCASLSATAQVSLNDGLDGQWYDTSAPGRAVSVDVLPRPDGGAYLYGLLHAYDTAGKPVWLSFLGDFAPGVNTLENVDLHRYEGGRFDSGTPAPAATVVGKVAIHVASCDSIAFVFDLDASAGLPDTALDVTRAQGNIGLPDNNSLCTQTPVLSACPTGTTTEGPDCLLPNSITGELYLPAGKKYLVKGAVIVEEGATLTIDPGVTVQGHEDVTQANFVGVKAGGRLYAEGTASRPIVFTGPTAEVGSWGGLHIAGRSTCNDYVSAAEPCRFEAYPDMTFGGGVLDDNSGVLRYVRIEWAGVPIRPNEELNSLTLLGVGAGTTIEYVQVDGGKDDGFEWFGGNVNGRHLVCSNMGDDCFDMDDGFHGKLQFLLAWQGDNFDIGGDSNGIESDNSNPSPDIQPRTRPEISNITLVGSSEYTNLHGLRIRRGSGGIYSNLVVTGFSGVSLALDGAETWAVRDDDLRFTHSFVGESGRGFFGGNAASVDDVALWFTGQEGNQTGNAKLDGYLPQADSPVLEGGKALDDPFFRPVTYRGAFAGAHDDWTRGWTANLPR